MSRDEIREILQNHEAIVTFTKVNGEERRMRCTLRQEVLPELKGSNHKRSMDVLPVWDLDANGWRSFRIDSIKKVEMQ